MKVLLAPLALSLAVALVSSPARAAEPAVEGALPPTASDKEKIEFLIRQDRLHTEEIARLKAELDRPKTRAELFAACMQAAKSQTSAMGAEAVGEHCDKLWKQGQ
jgi:hypothetical protein